MQNTTDIELGNVDADKAIAVELKHDDKLKEEEIAFFQVTTPTILYTALCIYSTCFIMLSTHICTL